MCVIYFNLKAINHSTKFQMAYKWNLYEKIKVFNSGFTNIVKP